MQFEYKETFNFFPFLVKAFPVKDLTDEMSCILIIHLWFTYIYVF